jgi:hypothetical protein
MGHGRPGWRSIARITVIVMDATAQRAVDQHGGKHEMGQRRLQGDSSSERSDGRSIVAESKCGNFKFSD